MNVSRRCPRLLQVNPGAFRLYKSSPMANTGVVGAKLLCGSVLYLYDLRL
jgi:hypothetical protein